VPQPCTVRVSTVPQDMLLQAQYSTWNWSMYFAASNRTLAARGGAVTKSIESRAGSFMTAQVGAASPVYVVACGCVCVCERGSCACRRVRVLRTRSGEFVERGKEGGQKKQQQSKAIRRVGGCALGPCLHPVPCLS
jgi:hypothetical protein